MLPSFVGVSYMVVMAMNESKSSQNDTLLKPMELYKFKHPKHMNFTFINCWLVFKDVPKWANMCDNLKKLVPLKRLTFPSDINEQLCEVCVPSIESNIEIMDFVVASNREHTPIKHPHGAKKVK